LDQGRGRSSGWLVRIEDDRALRTRRWRSVERSGLGCADQVADPPQHDLHCFEALRRMDEVLVDNFMVFDDVVRDEHYDLVVGDEAWDVPLRHHFEQNFHVRHRLDQYGAGRCLEYDAVTPDSLARAIADELGRETGYRPVESDGADRAAELIADLL